VGSGPGSVKVTRLFLRAATPAPTAVPATAPPNKALVSALSISGVAERSKDEFPGLPLAPAVGGGVMGGSYKYASCG